jgi:AcrR family transcriptional regulator
MTSTPRQTRDALLEAAEQLFSARGYAGVGTREIADQAGANLASIKYHFGSKRELYLETVRCAMTRMEHESPWAMLHVDHVDRDVAIDLLIRFVRSYLTRLLGDDTKHACAMLMQWEAIYPSEAIDDVVKDFIKPEHDALVNVVACVLECPPDDPTAHFAARSVLGQVLHYGVFREFIDRLERPRGCVGIDVDDAADHVVRFSLRAMGFDDATIDAALRRSIRTDDKTMTGSTPNGNTQ